MSPMMILKIYDHESYGHSNSVKWIWHMSLVEKILLVDQDIDGFETQGLER